MTTVIAKKLTFISTGEATPVALCPVLGTPVENRPRKIPTKGHKEDEEMGVSLI